MSTVGTARVATDGGDLAERRVTPLELFFGLVFVFALTQVTGFLADHLTWAGMLQGAALLAVLWWAWGGYSWLTNAVPAEEVIPARLVILTSMAAMLVASLAVPDAFGEYGVLFGLATSSCGSCMWSYSRSPLVTCRRRTRPSSALRRAFWPPRCCSSRLGSWTASPRAHSGRLRSRSTWAYH